jgi:hypothetical protein
MSSATETLDSYHSRNCKICRHDDRAAIEYDFLHWRSPDYIAKEYNLSTRAIHRHARAAGLHPQRRQNLRFSLETIIEGAGKVTPTVDGVLRAIEMYTRMSETGELVHVPKTQVIVVSRDGSQPVMPSIPGIKIDQAALGDASQLLEVAPEPTLDSSPHPEQYTPLPVAYPPQPVPGFQTVFGLNR